MSWVHDVQCFIDASKKVQNARELAWLILDITREMGFDYFGMGHHVDMSRVDDLQHMEAEGLRYVADTAFAALSNYPSAWAEIYMAHHIVERDCIVMVSERTGAGFRWDEMDEYINLTSEHRQIMLASVKAGLGLGYTVPANVRGEISGSCSFVVRTGRELPTVNLPMAQVVGTFAFEAARNLVLNARKAQKGEERTILTPRQIECLMLVARGKSDWEIARILGISEETVKRHIAAAREHYDVPKRLQVVLRAVYEGQFAIGDLFH